MRLKCLQCEHEFEGSVSLDELGWHSMCPKCGGSFDVDLPDGDFVIAFAVDDSDFWTDDFDGRGVKDFFAYHSAEALIAGWYKLLETHEGDWYWILHDGDLQLSGAFDPTDDERFDDMFAYLKEENA